MALTVAELIAEGIRSLESAGIDDAEISSRFILRHLLKQDSSGLQLVIDKHVSEEVADLFRKLIEKRCAHVPIQYIIGEVEFYNVKLKVDRGVMIPRPETEVLVENTISVLKQFSSPRLLDIGTGSGNIAIAIAHNIKDMKILAVDISKRAVSLAVENARLNGVLGNIEFIQDDCLQKRFWEKVGRFDVIVSNPPYVSEKDFDDLQPEIKLYEPKTALITSDDPLIFFKVIAENARGRLNTNGAICFEVGISQALKVSEILKSYLGSIDLKIVKDLTGIDRVIICRLP